MKAIIAIGSNMGARENYIEQALDRMESGAGHILARSALIETRAYGLTDQADFLNMAVLLETQLPPERLLETLHEIEADLDRVRLIRWGPRTIDLDIIFYEDRIIDTDRLHIPHIDFANRTFVLGPVCQIAPDYEDPRSKKTVKALYEELLEREEESNEMD